MPIRPLVDRIIRKFETGYRPFNYIELSRSRLLANYDYFQKLCPSSQIWPVLKSNAYGHGLQPVVSVLKERQFEYFVVDSYHEALKIWEVAPRKILLIAALHPDNFSNLNYKNLTLTIQDPYSLKKLASLRTPTRIHLKINTGMSRQGVEIEEIPQILRIILKNPQIELEGIYSHLADADNTDNSFTMIQESNFLRAIKLVRHNGVNPKFIHLAATSSSVKVNHHDFNAIRLGIGLYGINPLNPRDRDYKKLEGIKPVLSFKSTVVKTRTLQKGDCVSYNCTYTAPSSRTIGIIPVGYYEGISRQLGNFASVKYHDKYYPVIGLVCMNMAVVDFGKTTPALFDEVEVISAESGDKNSIISYSRACHATAYELLAQLNSSTRRLFA
jgi:alanine racemase